MIVNLLPSITMLFVVAWYSSRQKNATAIKLYLLIVSSYLLVFPSLDYVLKNGEGMADFLYIQTLIIGFFVIPLLGFISLASRNQKKIYHPISKTSIRLTSWLPITLGLFLLIFWIVALHFDLFQRRLGHEALARQSADVPALFLYIYRGVVETAFFTIIYLWNCVSQTTILNRYYRQYQIILSAFLLTFIIFFGLNSRMQFIILVLCLLCTQEKLARIFTARLWSTTVLLLVSVIGLTLLREIYLESNDRIDFTNLESILLAVSLLIIERLDSTIILYRLFESGLDPLDFHLSGISHVMDFYLAFFYDPVLYTAIKESLITSPSVEIANRFLSNSEIDFPKSMILDMFLSFGVLGLLLVSSFLGLGIGAIQTSIRTSKKFNFNFLISIYTLPLFLEFEKEFFGFIFNFLKWLPVLIFLYIARPTIKIAGQTNDYPIDT